MADRPTNTRNILSRSMAMLDLLSFLLIGLELIPLNDSQIIKSNTGPRMSVVIPKIMGTKAIMYS